MTDRRGGLCILSNGQITLNVNIKYFSIVGSPCKNAYYFTISSASVYPTKPIAFICLSTSSRIFICTFTAKLVQVFEFIYN